MIKFKSSKESDLIGVRNMSRKNLIEERSRGMKKYVLMERDNILNKYRRYLRT